MVAINKEFCSAQIGLLNFQSLVNLFGTFAEKSICKVLRIASRKFAFQCFVIVLFLFISYNNLLSQTSKKLPFFQPADTFHNARFWTCATGGAIAYTSLVIGLNEVWYKQYERGPFHFFDDVGEWNDMDKVGHTYTAYNESRLVFEGARWAGIKRRKAMWTAVGLGSLFQATIEVMDGFSEKWGFSMADMGFNTIGVGLFAGQEMLWQEQRVVMKFSSWQKPYPATTILSQDGRATSSLRKRAADLYGSGFPDGMIKDYNAQTYWLSANVFSFVKNKESKFPKWLNVAVGYSAGNMFGGFRNAWEEDGAYFVVDENLVPRYRQFFLAPDIDFTKLKVKSRFVRSLLYLVNIFKMPAPALEINTLGKVQFHPFYF